MDGNKPDKNSIQQAYEKSARKKYSILLLSIVLMAAMGFVFMTIGVADTSVGQVLRAVGAWIGGSIEGSADAASYKIIVLMRLPRIVMAVIAGIGLSVSGIAMQSITRNPLVSPFTIGISSAAAFGASVCIVFGTGTFFQSETGIVAGAFLSAFLCALLVYAVAQKAGMGPEAIVLTGIALNYFFSAMTNTIEFFAQEHKLAAVVQWTFGTFNGAAWREALTVTAFVIPCTFFISRFSLMLNAMASGDDETAKSLGINPALLRGMIGILSVLMTAAVISFTGVIGFVGLVAPHIARMLVGGDHRFLIPFGAVVGAMLLLISDTIGKTVLSPVSIPVGIVVSFLGVPLFINLILRHNRRDGL